MTAVRIAWEAPDLSACQFFKGYQIYLSKMNKKSFFKINEKNI